MDKQKILKGIMEDILNEIRELFASEIGVNLKVGKNTLKGSKLEHNVSGQVTDNSIDISFPHYIVFIEWDRPERYKNPPPYSVILNWIKEKNIQPTAGNIHTVEQLAWTIRYAIWRDGWTKRLIAGLNRDYDYMKSPLDQYIDKMWESKWSDEIYDLIMDEINRYFKD